ncbi:MAG TPA: hypothetical protein VK140_07005 [Ktedonobacteraceae bacterium]|nr:hypothetical protein [Ktedonobacteraceae bacterium]
MEQQRRSLPALRVTTPSLWEPQVVDASVATPIGEGVTEGTLVPRQDVKLLRELLGHEEMRVLLLDTKNMSHLN